MITLNLYTFKELGEEAKENAINEAFGQSKRYYSNEHILNMFETQKGVYYDRNGRQVEHVTDYFEAINQFKLPKS